jgi:hypothetical protein
MNKYFKKAKLEFFYWRKCIFEYRNFWKYIYSRYFLAKRILRHKGVLEKPINNPDLSIHILTCHRDFIMSLWSLASFYQLSGISGQLHVHNDGSLTQKDKNNFKKLFPNCIFIEQEDIDPKIHRLNNHLEVKKNRTEKADSYFLLKKLIDPFLVSDKNNILVIDSDLIWLKNSFEIQEELQKDSQNSLATANNKLTYIYFKNGDRISTNLASFNSGIVLYKKNNFNLDRLEEYFEKFDYKNPKNKHFIEQAGYAYCLENLKKLPEEKYVIDKNIDDSTRVRHYTSPRRPLFYAEGLSKIKKIIKL